MPYGSPPIVFTVSGVYCWNQSYDNFEHKTKYNHRNVDLWLDVIYCRNLLLWVRVLEHGSSPVHVCPAGE